MRSWSRSRRPAGPTASISTTAMVAKAGVPASSWSIEPSACRMPAHQSDSAAKAAAIRRSTTPVPYRCAARKASSLPLNSS
ncbi:hypothetical protein ACPC54_31190 [Kitasatospora sp. NPDC094028]